MGNFNHNPEAVWWLPPEQRPAPREAIARICIALKAGAPERAAVALAGYEWEDFERWMKVDPTFATQVNQAKAVVVVRATGVIRAAMADDWRAADLFLRRAGQDSELDRLKGLTTDGD